MNNPPTEMKKTVVTLSRELRFGLSEEEMGVSANGFAGNPALTGLAPFLTLQAQVRGEVDGKTGMLVNIKDIDKALRTVAVPRVRAYYRERPGRGGGDLVVALAKALEFAFDPHEFVALSIGFSPYLTHVWRAKVGGKHHESIMEVSRKDHGSITKGSQRDQSSITKGSEMDQAWLKKESNVAELSLKFEFSAAHRLHSEALSAAENWEVFGKCNNANGHGHNYELEVTVEGEPDERTGQILPILQLQKIVNERVVNVFDHKHLNLDCVEFAGLNPTVENIARVIFEKLGPGIGGGARLTRVRVWETPKTWCEYGGGEG